jgi:hypothetical protein
MIWDVNQAEPWEPAKVYDANGEEITYVVWMDTDTGEVVQLKHDGESLVFNGDRSDIVRQLKFYPAPLRVVPITEPAA